MKIEPVLLYQVLIPLAIYAVVIYVLVTRYGAVMVYLGTPLQFAIVWICSVIFKKQIS